MQNFSAGIVKPESTEILVGPPRSGHFSVYAYKICAQSFVWLCSIVVWGSVVNVFAILKKCNTNCIFQLAFSFIAWIAVSSILVLNLLAENSSRWRNSCFSHGVEAQLTAVLIILWIPVVSTASSPDFPYPVTTWFAWLGFFGSIYATYKAYHSFKEQDLPSDVPDGYDEEDYVYG